MKALRRVDGHNGGPASLPPSPGTGEFVTEAFSQRILIVTNFAAYAEDVQCPAIRFVFKNVASMS
jgi:hypothetical protein